MTSRKIEVDDWVYRIKPRKYSYGPYQVEVLYIDNPYLLITHDGSFHATKYLRHVPSQLEELFP